MMKAMLWPGPTILQRYSFESCCMCYVFVAAPTELVFHVLAGAGAVGAACVHGDVGDGPC